MLAVFVCPLIRTRNTTQLSRALTGPAIFAQSSPRHCPRGRIILAKNALTEGDTSLSASGAAMIRFLRLAVTIADFRTGGGVVTALRAVFG
jgi:hypothetical protein